MAVVGATGAVGQTVLDVLSERSFPISELETKLPEYFDALMDYAELAKWGKRGLSREEARERAALAHS